MDLNTKTYLLSIELLRNSIESFDEYPFNLPAVRNLDRLELHPKVTFIVGENGTGKSTLLEAIAVWLGMNPEGGSRNFTFSTRASHSNRHRHLRISKSARRPNDTEHYIITRRFLDNPEKLLAILLAPPEGKTDLRKKRRT